MSRDDSTTFIPEAVRRNNEVKALLEALSADDTLNRTTVLASLETIKALGELYLPL